MFRKVATVFLVSFALLSSMGSPELQAQEDLSLDVIADSEQLTSPDRDTSDGVLTHGTLGTLQTYRSLSEEEYKKLQKLFEADEEDQVDSDVSDDEDEFDGQDVIIVGKTHFDSGEPISFEARVREGLELVGWEWESALELRPMPGEIPGTYSWTAGPGKDFLVRFNYAVKTDDSKFKLGHDVHSFGVGKVEPDKTLAELAGEQKDALAKIYVGLALPSVDQDLFPTPFQWLVAHDVWISQATLANNAAVPVIRERIVDAIGDFDDDGIDKEMLRKVLNEVIKELGANPNPNPPNPPNPPVPTPDDPWGVTESVAAIIAASPESVKAKASATADLFLQAAEGIDSVRFSTINQAATWLRAERSKLWGADASAWSAFESGINETWNAHWPMLKGDVANFYRCIAAGLKR